MPHADQTLVNLTAALEAGKSDKLVAYLAAMERFHNYSLGTIGLSSAEEFSTLSHEFAHEMLHRGENGKRPAKTIRDTEAEAVAFVVCQAFGLDTNTAASDYI